MEKGKENEFLTVEFHGAYGRGPMSPSRWWPARWRYVGAAKSIVSVLHLRDGRVPPVAGGRVWALLAAVLVLGLQPTAAVGSRHNAVPQGSPSLSVDFRDGLLSIAAADVPWATLLGELQAKTGVVMRPFHRAAGSLTASFNDVTFELALKKLFGVDANFIFLYDAENAPMRSSGSGIALPSEVWVFSGGQQPSSGVTIRMWSSGETAHERTAEDPAAGAGRLAALADLDAAVRKDAAESLGESEAGNGDWAVEALSQALQSDSDLEVRKAAAAALARIGTAQALTAFRLALNDSEVEVRESAIEAISNLGGKQALVIIRDALHDPDEQVRNAARVAIEELLAGDQPDVSTPASSGVN